MKTRPIYSFDGTTSTGLDKVPLNHVIVVEDSDGAGTPKQVLLKVKQTDPNLTIATFLAGTDYKEMGGGSTLTASEILTEIKTVDGTGSGLDADLLDGIESTSFLRSDAADTATAKITIQKDVGTTPTYSTGQFELKCLDAGDVSMGFHRSGYTACQLRHESNGLILSGVTPTTSADFYAYGNITAYSDERLKTDIQPIPNAIDKILQLSGYTFLRTNAAEGAELIRETGVIAQEVRRVLPEAVKEDNVGMLSVAYGNMVGLLIEGIKEQQEQINDMKKEITILKGE